MQQYCLQKKLFWTAPNYTLLKTLPTSTNKSDIIKILWLQQLHLDTEKKRKKTQMFYTDQGGKKNQKTPQISIAEQEQ